MDLSVLVFWAFIVWAIGVVCGVLGTGIIGFIWMYKAMDPHDRSDEARGI